MLKGDMEFLVARIQNEQSMIIELVELKALAFSEYL